MDGIFLARDIESDLKPLRVSDPIAGRPCLNHTKQEATRRSLSTVNQHLHRVLATVKQPTIPKEHFDWNPATL